MKLSNTDQTDLDLILLVFGCEVFNLCLSPLEVGRIKRRNAFISYLFVLEIFFFPLSQEKPQGWELSHDKLHCSAFSLSR